MTWYRVLNRRQWNTLIVANAGWLFDGYEAANTAHVPILISKLVVLLLLDVFLQRHPACERSVQVPLGVGRNAFLRSLGIGI